MNQKTINMNNRNISTIVTCFDNGTEVREYHAIIQVTAGSLPWAQQLDAVMSAYQELLSSVPDAQAVFKRYFLSDAANQADDVVVADVTDCAKSIIQQLERIRHLTRQEQRERTYKQEHQHQQCTPIVSLEERFYLLLV